MPQISITSNAPQVKKALENLASDIPEIGRGRIYGYTQRVVKRLKEYPPKPVGSKYKRTFKLRKSVMSKEIKNGYRISVDPVAKGKHYGKYPLGNAYGQGQAWMHVGRWTPMRDVADQEAEKLPKEIRDQIITVARRKGF
jgi:hypothetical protein